MARMTQRNPAEKTEKRANDGIPGIGLGMALPKVSTNLLSGLMEAVAGAPFDGKADLPDLARILRMEVDDLFPIVETLQLLRMAELEEGDVSLTEFGQRFVHSDVDQRKKLFADHLIAYVPLAALIRRVLDERPSHRAPFTRFCEEFGGYNVGGSGRGNHARRHFMGPLWRTVQL